MHKAGETFIAQIGLKGFDTLQNRGWKFLLVSTIIVR